MLSDSMIENAGPCQVALLQHWRDTNWKHQHDNLVKLHEQKTKLEAELVDRLFDFSDAGLYKRLGYPSMKHYMMSEFGYTAHTASEYDRVARELLDLPEINDAFHAGELCWSKVRELTRTAVIGTEDKWLAAIEGKTATEVQQLVSGKKKGALPDDAPDPKLMTQWVGAEVSAEVAAMWKLVRVELEREAKRALSNAELVEALLARAMQDPGEKAVTPPVQLAVTTCRQCRKGHQVGPGVELELSASKLAAVRCDAVHVGDLESDEVVKLESEIPAPTRRKVYVRDHFACTVPGCTSTRFLHLHHVVWREHGGTHEASNLTLLCGGHHGMVHEGIITITGAAPNGLAFSMPDDGD